MNNILELTEKQLRNMSTQRLNEIRKKLIPPVSKFNVDAKAGNVTESDYIFLSKLEERYHLVKELLDDRENLETSKNKKKTPRREDKRDRVYDED